MKKTEVKIAHMGSNSGEATLHHWIKKEGEQVREGEPLAELETDKVNFELEAPASGLLIGVLASEEQVVKFGEVVAYIESD
jgi:pyruvate/2-oxoglutarate dehydrogenase complex dihydrolipoamide acyltransferase (E2) component